PGIGGGDRGRADRDAGGEPFAAGRVADGADAGRRGAPGDGVGEVLRGVVAERAGGGGLLVGAERDRRIRGRHGDGSEDRRGDGQPGRGADAGRGVGGGDRGGPLRHAGREPGAARCVADRGDGGGGRGPRDGAGQVLRGVVAVGTGRG